jgi:uncharacterized protein (DUF39 family)
LIVLECKLKPESAIGNLDAEIQAMTAPERNALRNFLMFLKDGGQPVDECFDELKIAADNAVYAARERLGEAT